MKPNKNQLILMSSIVAILEIVYIIFMRNSEAKLTLIAGVIGIPVVIIAIYLILYSVENAFIIGAFLTPILPISGYVLLRLDLLDMQWIVYAGFYLLILVSLIKNGIFKKLTDKNIIVKDKLLRLIIVIFLLLNIFFAYNKRVTFLILTISFIPIIVFFMILRFVKVKDKKKLLKNILLALLLGSIISAIPDLLYFFISCIRGNRNIRIYGPLGSNFMLIYILLLYPIVLANWAKEKTLKNIWTLYVIGFSTIISLQLSRGALLSFVAILITFLIFNIKNWKRYITIALVFGSILTYNVTARPDVKSDTGVKELHEVVTGKIDQNDLPEGGINGILKKIIESQSKNRQILWKTGILLAQENPIGGVGLGNYQYFFQEYSGSDRNYADAHNIFINMASELGVPFMLLSMILLVIIGIGSCINYFKNRKNNDLKLTYLALMVSAGVFLIYGNLTGIAFQSVVEVYSFTPTFVIVFLLFYRDYIDVFKDSVI